MTLMGSVMHGYQYSLHIHQKYYVHGMWIVTGEVPWNLSVTKSRSVKSTTLSTHFLMKITTILNYFSMSLRDVLTISTQCFAKYFKLEYNQHKHQCATRYWKIAGINTNMYVEAFHHTLKCLYMKGKINQHDDVVFICSLR